MLRVGRPVSWGPRASRQPPHPSLVTAEGPPTPPRITQSLLETFIWAVGEDKRLRRRKRSHARYRSRAGPGPAHSQAPADAPVQTLPPISDRHTPPTTTHAFKTT